MNNVADELALRKLLAIYSDACWRKDGDSFASAWAEDGEWLLVGQKLVGKAMILGFWEQFMQNFTSTWQVQHTMILELDGDLGRGRIYVDEHVVLPNGGGMFNRGIYHDDYAKVDGRWLFKRRHFDLVHKSMLADAGTAYSTLPYGPAPVDPDRNRPATPPLEQVLP
jgi:uncharacterized protein (TIGR02246 family)